MNKKKLNVGFIGAGFIGQIAHISNFAELNNCNLYALAEMRPQLREQVGVRYGFERLYEDHKELLSDDNVDAVVVVVPRPYTAEIVADCLKAGKHVLSEKPMAGNALEGQKLINSAKQHGVQYCVGYMKRFDEGVEKAKALLDQLLVDGSLGKVLQVNGFCYMGESYCNAGGHIVTDEQPSYTMNTGDTAPEGFDEQQANIFARYVNVYSHLTNLLDYFFEQTPTVDYFNFIEKTSHTCVLNYQYFLATLHTGEASNRLWDEGLDIQFEHGKLSIRLPPALLRHVPAKVTLYKAGQSQELIEPLPNWTWAFHNQAKAFVEDVLNERASKIDARYALKDLALIEQFWVKKNAG